MFKSLTEQRRCLDNLIAKFDENEVAGRVLYEANSQIDSWLNRGVQIAQLPNPNYVSWQIAEFALFDSNQLFCLTFLLTRSLDADAHHDAIQIMVGRFESGNWEFFLQSMKTYIINRRKLGGGAPLSYASLESKSKDIAIRMGYLKWRSCKINDKFFDRVLPVWAMKMQRRILGG